MCSDFFFSQYVIVFEYLLLVIGHRRSIFSHFAVRQAESSVYQALQEYVLKFCSQSKLLLVVFCGFGEVTDGKPRVCHMAKCLKFEKKSQLTRYKCMRGDIHVSVSRHTNNPKNHNIVNKQKNMAKFTSSVSGLPLIMNS